MPVSGTKRCGAAHHGPSVSRTERDQQGGKWADGKRATQWETVLGRGSKLGPTRPPPLTISFLFFLFSFSHLDFFLSSFRFQIPI
jgi:hypothetical protein